MAGTMASGAPSPASGWGSAFLAQNASAAGQVQAAVQSEIAKAKGACLQQKHSSA